MSRRSTPRVCVPAAGGGRADSAAAITASRSGGARTRDQRIMSPAERVRRYPRLFGKASRTSTFKPWTFAGIRERLS